MNYILALIFGVLLFLLFPVFLNVNIFVDVHARKMYFSFYVLRLIKIYGGYATLYDEGIAFHLTKNKAVLLPYREIINTRQKFEITRGFYVFAYSHTLEVGTEDASRAVTLSALAQIVSGIVAGYIFSERKCVSFKTDLILYANKKCLKASGRIVLVFNFLILFIAAFKIFLQKVLEKIGNEHE